MPIHQRWDPGCETLFVRLEPPVSAEAFLEWARALNEDSSLPAGRRELIDLSDVEGSDIAGESLRELADAFRSQDRTHGQTRIALLVSRDIVFGLGRMYQAYRGENGVDLEVFRDGSEARRWLDLPDDVPGA
jgi:hypothetical protein